MFSEMGGVHLIATKNWRSVLNQVNWTLEQSVYKRQITRFLFRLVLGGCTGLGNEKQINKISYNQTTVVIWLMLFL